jgi:hypothetical protein
MVALAEQSLPQLLYGQLGSWVTQQLLSALFSPPRLVLLTLKPQPPQLGTTSSSSHSPHFPAFHSIIEFARIRFSSDCLQAALSLGSPPLLASSSLLKAPKKKGPSPSSWSSPILSQFLVFFPPVIFLLSLFFF